MAIGLSFANNGRPHEGARITIKSTLTEKVGVLKYTYRHHAFSAGY
jgi:hypothetical protein